MMGQIKEYKLLYTPKKVTCVAPDYGVTDIKYNEQQLEKIDLLAKKNGNLVGRYIRERINDGYAYYQIVKENKKTVIIVFCTGFGFNDDEYMIPSWGKMTSINKDYIIDSICKRDAYKETCAIIKSKQK